MEGKSFFSPQSNGISAAEIIHLTNADLIQGDKDQKIYDVADLLSATSSHLTYVESPKWQQDLQQTQAGVCIVNQQCLAFVPKNITVLCHPIPSLAFAKIMRHLYPDEKPSASIHPTALIDPTADIHPTATIGPGVVIGPRVCIGQQTILEAYVVIGRDVIIGDHCSIGPHVSIQFSFIGNRVTILPGARLGQRGFGFAHGEKVPIAIPHIGAVIIGDDVEIGANTTIDRGKLGNTVIGQGTIIDNLVMIGHNVQVGQNCIFCGQVGISGSTIVGDHVVMGGQVGIADHVKIGNKVSLGAQSGVMKDINDGETLIGSPVVPMRQYMRQVIALKKLAEGKKDKTG